MMRRFFLTLVLLLLVPATALAAGGAPAHVVLKPHAVIDGPMVLLGDLFEGVGDQASIAIARAPAPGKRVEVGAIWLAAVAQAYGLSWQPRSRLERTLVERASHTIDTRRIESTMIQALERRGVDGRISLVLDQPGLRLDLPSSAEPTLAVAAMTYDPDSGRFTALLVAPADGSPLAKATISGRAVAMTEIPVLRRRVEPGAVIRSDDIEWVSTRADRLGRDIVIDTDNLLGKSPRRPMRPGDPVRASELQAPVVVAKNSLVTIRLDTAHMSLAAQGRALEPGSTDDVIRVMNTKSNRVLNAAVVDSGTVRVVSPALRSANE